MQYLEPRAAYEKKRALNVNRPALSVQTYEAEERTADSAQTYEAEENAADSVQIYEVEEMSALSAQTYEMEERPAKKTRGVNLKWRQIAVHDNVETALSLYSPRKMIERDLIKGKVVRTKTVVYNFSCGKKTCGCKKQYRLITVECANEVIEEETLGDHINHDQYQRNNGRGLSFSQSHIIEDALRDNNKKPQKVFDYFVTVAERGILREGEEIRSLR